MEKLSPEHGMRFEILFQLIDIKFEILFQWINIFAHGDTLFS